MIKNKNISQQLDEYETLLEILASGQANNLSEVEQAAFKKQFYNAFKKLKEKIEKISTDR